MNSSFDENSSADPMLPLVEEYVQRKQQGESVSLEEYCDKYPELAEEIRELFPALEIMQELQPQSEDHRDVAASHDLPEQIGDYRIVAEIGRGGMGVVYEAEQQSLRRRVALKVLPNNFDTAGNSKQRFQQEARAAAMMHHTNIVPVFEVGEEGNHVFYAMQLISGQSLDRVIEELKNTGSRTNVEKLGQPASDAGAASSSASLGSSVFGDLSSDAGSGHHRQFYRSVAKIGSQTADALSFAHARGVIHRDIKPSNLLLDAGGVVWVTDFGLAKLDDEGLTETGDFVGTLRYMSPERFRGDCDQRSDIYSVGLTLYELLARRPAFESSDHVSLIRMISSEEPARLRLVNSQIPRDLETIVSKSIDREPRFRYRTARALAEDLERYLQDQPIKARRHSIPERLVRWSRRNRSLSAAVAAIAVMAIVTITVLALSLRTARIATAEARQFAARALLTQADLAFDNQQFQSASVLAAASRNISPSEAATAKLRSSYASVPASLRWMSPTLGDLSTVATSRNGRCVAAASKYEDTIWVWDVDSFQHSHRLSGHTEMVRALAFDPLGKRILSGSQDQSVRLWDVDSGDVQWTHSIPAAPGHVAIDPTGELAAAGGVFRGTVWVWDCASGKQLHRFEGDGSPARAITFDRTADTLAVGFEDGTIKTWNLTDKVETVFDYSARVHSIEFLPGGGLAVAGDGGLSIMNLDSGRRREISFDENATRVSLSTLSVDPAGQEVAVGASDGTIRFLHAETLQEVRADRLDVGNPLIFLGHCRDGSHLIVGTTNQGRRSTDQSIRMIHRSTGQTTAWVEGHVEPTVQLAFSADGTRLVSAAADRTIRVWDTESGAMLERIADHPGAIHCVQISPDASVIASGGSDETLRLWNLNSGTKHQSSKHGSALTGVAFHPSENVLASSTSDTIGFWSLPSGPDDPLRRDGPAINVELSGTNEGIQARTLRFSPDGKLIACGTTRGRVLLWSATSHKLVAEFRPDANRAIFKLVFSSDVNRLAVQCHEYSSKVFDITNPSEPVEIQEIIQPPSPSMTMTPSGDVILMGTYDQSVHLYSVETGRKVSSIEGHRERIHAIEFSADGNMLACASGAELRLWDFNEAKFNTIRGSVLTERGREWKDHYDMLFATELSEDENKVLIRGMWGGSYNAILLDRATGQKRAFKGAYGGDIDPKNRWVAICTKSGDLDLYAANSDDCIPLQHNRTAIKSLVFNCDGSLLAGIGPGDISVWDTETKNRLYTFPAHLGGKRNRLAFHPSAPNLLASGGDDGMVYLWRVDSTDYKRLRQLDGHSEFVGHMSFSKDGKRLATCGRGESPPALLWDLETGKILQRFFGHAIRINGVDISPDDRWVATASSDFTVRLWDTRDGTEVRRFQDHTDDVYSVKFIDDGRQLITASADGTIQFIDLSRGDEKKEISVQQLEAETGMRLEGEHLRLIPNRVQWHVEP